MKQRIYQNYTETKENSEKEKKNEKGDFYYGEEDTTCDFDGKPFGDKNFYENIKLEDLYVKIFKKSYLSDPFAYYRKEFQK